MTFLLRFLQIAGSISLQGGTLRTNIYDTTLHALLSLKAFRGRERQKGPCAMVQLQKDSLSSESILSASAWNQMLCESFCATDHAKVALQSSA